MKKVFFVGEINVDLMLGGLASFPIRDREVTCSSFEKTIGSSTAICACNYASLGGRASFMGLAGEDEYGDYMAEGMRQFGIETSAIRRTTKVNTGVTVNLIYKDSRTQVTYPGTISEFSAEDIDFQALEDCHHIHIGGPYLQTRFLGAVTSILSFARENQISTSLDPQWDSTEKWQYLDEWLPLLTYFFPNRDEALSMSRAESVEDACRWLADHLAYPIVKNGKQGITLMLDGKLQTIASYPTRVVDTTGAGDAFDAGFMFGILEKGMDVAQAADFASAVAARSCMFAGGVNARSSYAEIEEFRKKAAR